MAKPIKYTATAPDGTIHTRNSHRTYSHAVLVKDGNGWGAYSWAGRPDLAQKKVQEANRYREKETVVVAVEVVA